MASRSLGTLTLDLVLKMGGFQQGLDKSARELDKRSREMSARAKKLGTEIGIGLSAIGGVAIAGLSKYIANTIEAEKVQAQLASRIKDTGAAAGRSLQQLNEQADKLQSITVFDDEAIGSVQAMLLTFKEIQGVNFDDATAAVLDLSTAMGMDAQSAALQLGKALNDPVKGLSALGRAGVQFSADQKKLIKDMVEAGNVAGAQRVILAELEGQMGTAAEAARNTLGGALQGLQNNFDNLLEGDTSGAGLKGTVEAINDLSDSLNDPQLKDGIDTVAGGILRIGSAAIQAIANVGKFASNLGKIFADAGLAPGDELKQLEARRKAIAEKGADSVIGRLFPERVQEELADLDRQIAEYPFRNVVSSVSDTGQPRPKAAGAPDKKPKKAGKTDEERDAERLQKAYESLNERLAEQVALYGSTGEAAKLRYELENGELSKLTQAQKDNLLVQAEAYDLMVRTKEEEEELSKFLKEQHDAFEDRMKSNEELIESMEFELKLLGMTNTERERAIALSYLSADATDAQKQAVLDLSDALIKASENAEFMASTQQDLADSFADFITGARSASEAFGDFADSLLQRSAQLLSDRAIEALFDAFSGTGGSGGGGGWGNFFSSLFGGGKADGGWTAANKVYEINERGFEVATVGNRDYMLTGNSPIQITPNHMLGGGGGGSITQQFYTMGRETRETSERKAQVAGREASRALARTGR